MTHPKTAAKASAYVRVRDFLQANGETAVTASTVGALTGSGTARARQVLDDLVARRQAERLNDNGVIRYRAATTEQAEGVDR